MFCQFLHTCTQHFMLEIIYAKHSCFIYFSSCGQSLTMKQRNNINQGFDLFSETITKHIKICSSDQQGQGKIQFQLFKQTFHFHQIMQQHFTFSENKYYLSHFNSYLNLIRSWLHFLQSCVIVLYYSTLN